MPWFYTYTELDKPDITRSANELAVERFALTEDYARTTFNTALELLATLQNFDYTIPTEWQDFTIDAQPPSLGDQPVAIRPGDYVSSITDIVFSDIEALRNSLGLVETTINQVTIPPLEAVMPSILEPDVPDSTMPDIPDGDVPLTEIDMPVRQQYTMPEVPTFEELVPVAPPVLSEHTMDLDDYPDFELVPPEPMFVYYEQTYQSNVADALRTKLYHDITVGGTGLADDVEAAIIARALDALDVELEKNYNSVVDVFESMGHEFPPGAFAGAYTQQLNESNRNRTNLTRDIMIQQSKLAQENTHFAITSGLQHEQQLMSYANQVAQRALEAARTQVEMVLAIFDGRVKARNSLLEGIKIKAQVFESLIRSELAKVELYKGQIEGSKLTAEQNKNILGLYLGRLDAISKIAEIYRVEMDGAKIVADIDRLKIENLRVRIEAAAQKINAVTSQYNLYQAQWAGEQIKVDLYSKQVDAHGKILQGVKTEADINIAEAQLGIEANKNRLAVLTAAIEKYRADAQVMSSVEDANVKAYSAKTGMYEAESKARSDFLAVAVDKYKGEVSAAATELELISKQLEVFMKTQTALKEIQAEAIRGGTTLAAQMASSALSSVSASAQVGFSEALSQSYQAASSVTNSRSTSCQYNESEGQQYIEQHIFNGE